MRVVRYACALALLAAASSCYAYRPAPVASTVAFEGLDCPTDQPQYLECCSCDGCCCGRWHLFPQSNPAGIEFHGWVNGGYIWNTDDPASNYNGPYNAVDRANEGMLNQLYFIAEKGLPCCGHGIGGRIDLLYGEDFFLAQSNGIERRPNGDAHWNGEYYGVAFPQAYATMGNQCLSLQVGHFYSVVGYEGVMAPDNFFYSHSYSYQFAGPFTHWGGMVNWQVSEPLSLQLGVHNGWDAFDRTTDRPGVIAKAKYEFCKNFWTSLAITSGDETNNLAGLAPVPDDTNRTRYSFLVNVPVTRRVEYVFHHWLGFQADGAPNGDDTDWYGIDQYLYVTLNNCWKAGARFEWFHDEDGTRVGLNRVTNPNNPPFPGDFYSITAGLNYSPTCNLTLRPEIRYDWYDGNAQRLPFNDGLDDNQLMIGVDGILLF